jgi:ATP citrate (pro-S)-lyase
MQHKHTCLQVKMIVILGELGGLDEYGVVEALKSKGITKPVVSCTSSW